MSTPDGARKQRWPDLAGRLVERDGAQAHVLPVRVYFEDTDFSGLVYHASYLRWCERGRSDFLRLLGNDHRGLITGETGREPAAFVVRRMALEFLKPARIDEVLEVETRVQEIGAAHLVLDQRICKVADGAGPMGPTPAHGPSGQALLEATVTVVLVSVSGKPMRLSGAIRTALGSPAG